jgi:hypothetical protein
MSKNKFKRTKIEKAKEKNIEFSLSKEMKMPDLLKKGYNRKEIITLFESLEKEGLGQYVKGKRGRGNPATFIANDDCPEKAIIAIKVFRERRENKEEKEEKVDFISNKIKESTRKLELQPCPDIGNGGYAIGIDNEKAFLVRPIEGGFDSIEQAVKSCIELFDDACCFKSKVMNKPKQIASKLRGLGFINLKGI